MPGGYWKCPSCGRFYQQKKPTQSPPRLEGLNYVIDVSYQLKEVKDPSRTEVYMLEGFTFEDDGESIEVIRDAEEINTFRGLTAEAIRHLLQHASESKQ